MKTHIKTFLIASAAMLSQNSFSAGLNQEGAGWQQLNSDFPVAYGTHPSVISSDGQIVAGNTLRTKNFGAFRWRKDRNSMQHIIDLGTDYSD